jgi:V8-like Glu-specific endopeptidase
MNLFGLPGESATGERMKNSIISMGVALILSACGSSQDQFHPTNSSTVPQAFEDSVMTITQSKIIGTNEMVKVNKDGSNVDANLRPYLNAFGIIDLGGGVCSGTHIGNGYVLTAGHCLMKGQFGEKLNEECSNIRVLWGYRGSPATGSPKPIVNQISNCQKIVYAELSKERDFAILKMDSAPAVSIKLSKTGARISNGTRLTIFGYPQGRPLEWSTYCGSQQIPQLPSMFAHNCDTEPGNSGSTVLAINESGTPSIIGIHDSGTEYFNMGTHLIDAINAMKSKAKFNLFTATSSL